MKLLKLILLLVIFIYGCKKNPSDIKREPFTSDQLQWIQNPEKPKFKVVTKKNNIINSIDTIETKTVTETHQEKASSPYQLSNLYYYQGSYDLKFVNFYNFFVKASLNINNENGFVVSANNYFPIIDSRAPSTNITNPDTAKIDGLIYNDVYKLINLGPSNYKTYFKKGVGFLYFEKDSVSGTASINYTASFIP